MRGPKPPARSHPSPQARKARWGVILLFWLNGVTFSSLLPRYPEIKTALAMSDTVWGLSVGLGPVGGLAAGLATARLMRRFTSGNVAVAAQFGPVILLNLVGNAPAAWVFAGGLFLMQGFDAVTDIAMNAHGLRVQREYGRSILNSFHAWWSIGAVSGGFIGSAAAQARVPIWLQCVVLALLFGGMTLASRLLLLPGPDSAVEVVTGSARKTNSVTSPVVLRLIALGVVGAAAGLIEDTGATWGAVYMDREFAVVPFVAGMAFVALQGTQMVGRFTGDMLVDRTGPRGALVQGAVIAAVGMGLALFVPSPVGTILGFSCAGWGIATVIPSVMRAADELPGLPAGTGLTIVTWLLRLGFLLGPPIIGALGDIVSLRVALFAAPACALIMLLLSPSMSPVPQGERAAPGPSD